MTVAGTDAPAVDDLAALADPTRLAILALLRQRDYCVCHLVELLHLKQNVISHHVGVLRRAGLVTSYPHPNDRRWLYYRLQRERLVRIAEQLGWFADASEYEPTPMPCGADLTPDGAE